MNDIHALHADFAKRFDVGEIVETPWGMDELYVIDPSGSLVKFGQLTDRFIQADAVQEAPRACRSTAPSFCRAIFPELRGTILLSLGIGWAAVLGAEYLGAQSGLGYIIIYSEQIACLDRMFVVALIFVFYASISYAIFDRLSRWLLQWTPQAGRVVAHG